MDTIYFNISVAMTWKGFSVVTGKHNILSPFECPFHNINLNHIDKSIDKSVNVIFFINSNNLFIYKNLPMRDTSLFEFVPVYSRRFRHIQEMDRGIKENVSKYLENVRTM